MMFPVVTVGTEPESLPAFIVGSNGIFLRKQSALGVTQAKVEKIAHLPAVESTIEYALPRIPAAISAQIAGFLRDVWRKNKSEGAVLLCLDREKQWQIVIPRQEVGGGHAVKYFIDDDTVPQGWRTMGTVHSHPADFTQVAPKASSIDEGDERKMDGLHLVCSSLEREPKYGAAVVADGTRWQFTQWWDVIEPAEPVDVPVEWVERVTHAPVKKWSVPGPSKWFGGGHSTSSGPWETVREGETAMDAWNRINDWRFKEMERIAKKLGIVFEIAAYEAPDEDDEGESEQPSVWSSIKAVACEGKHPASNCPNNCGCHCQPCRDGLVGSFKVEAVGTKPCSCALCWKGCDITVRDEESVCEFCAAGSHYTAEVSKA